MKIMCICLGILYLIGLIWLWYEIKHAIIIPDNIDLDNWCPTQEELDEILKRGKSGI